MPQIFIGLMALIGIFGVGSYWRNGENPVNISTKQLTAGSSNVSKYMPNQTPQATVNSTISPTGNVRIKEQSAPPVQNPANKSADKRIESAPATAETFYYCGAATKKGTPCSRRVKGGGRCWQHQGQTAILPPEKLIASQ